MTLPEIFSAYTLDYDPQVNNLVLFSGGKGSFLTACLLKSKNLPFTLYFNDTYYEHNSLYVFMDLCLSKLQDKEPLGIYKNIPSLKDWENRRIFLNECGKTMEKYYPDFVYDASKESLHELILRRKFMPNSRVDICSEVLKRMRSQEFVKKFSPEEIRVCVGIGIWEQHRTDKAKPYWLPYTLTSPLQDANCFESDIKEDVFSLFSLQDPYLYQIGLAHNNCAGFCVKAGLKHYRQLLESDRDLYLIHEENEQTLYKKQPKLRPFLQSQVNKKKYYITLKQWREFLENGVPYWDIEGSHDTMNEDYGSCNCAI